MAGRDSTLLTEVMDTIASFKDIKGSPPDKILDRMISQRKTPLRNASLQVKKALKSGLKSGLLKEAGGKFKLGLGTKEYAIFKKFRMLEKGKIPIRELRRRGRRRRRSKRRRRGGRRRSDFLDIDNLELNNELQKDVSSLKLAKSISLPVRELRRRSKRRRRSRRRGRRGRRRGDIDIMTMDDNLENDTNGELTDRSRRRRGKRRRRSRRRGRRRALEDEGESVNTSESKELTRMSSEEKPKTAKSGHGENRNPLEKRDIVPDANRTRVDENGGSGHCCHSFHHDGGHYGHPPQGHYENEYYN